MILFYTEKTDATVVIIEKESSISYILYQSKTAEQSGVKVRDYLV